MILLAMRTFFILLAGGAGYQIATLLGVTNRVASYAGVITGVFGGLVFILLEQASRRGSIKILASVIFGLAFGLVMAKVLTDLLIVIPTDPNIERSVEIILTVVLCYLGMMIAYRAQEEFSLVIPFVRLSPQGAKEKIAILDTSVIIDGRIADICQTQFLQGRLIVPRFVLQELQQLADSSDDLKRNRGRRGLEVLGRIQKDANVEVRIHEEDFPETREVDEKLVKLAKVLDAKIFTNDFNLNRVAELQGVPVLNINELVNTLKPVVLPGESLEIRLIKEGKERDQAVAYLDDGTMVVVEGGRHLIGQKLKATVTSTIQTQAGKMIFAKVGETGRNRR